MDNPARTAEYLSLVEDRRDDLRARFALIFPQPTRFVWEVGCGHGHFLTAYAKAHPDRSCVGIDITSDRIVRANRKRDRANLTNLHFVHAEARAFLELLPQDANFADIYVLFPDPWPKSRHHKHRIMQSDFLTSVARRAGENTRIYFRTDYRPYFESVSDVLGGHSDWRPVEEPWPFEHETVFQSRAKHYSSLVAVRRTHRGGVS